MDACGLPPKHRERRAPSRWTNPAGTSPSLHPPDESAPKEVSRVSNVNIIFFTTI